MPGDEPMPQSIQPEQHVLVYDRIAKNRRQTWVMMSLFVGEMTKQMRVTPAARNLSSKYSHTARGRSV